MAREALAALRQGASDESFGDGFLHGFEFTEREPDEISMLFGSEFTKQVEGTLAGAWSGPVASSYGLHLIRIESRSEPRTSKLDEVRAAVIRDFKDECRRKANRDLFERLRQRYEITVDEAAIFKAARPALRTAQVTR